MSKPQESNICQVCGGAIRLEYVFTLERCRPGELRVEPQPFPQPFRLCPGHFGSETAHDGKLDGTEEWSHASVESIENVRDDLGEPKVGGIHLHGGYGDCESNCIYLDAKQSLSLLAWLEQNRQTLEQIAKEQQ